MKKLLMCFSLLLLLVACSNKEAVITKKFVEDNAKIDLTYDEVRDIFGKETLSDIVDHTETWLYDSAKQNNIEYTPSLEVVAFDEIKNGKLDYQLYINFIDRKAFMYSYFYKGDDGKVWQYTITPDAKPFNGPVSD
ncbi:PhoU family transcriptional regulator [Lysinibacillus xylanilyticus]|uniref:PhoU family transcriptional regulator n=1 Tax=Lysinibacillus xylanilyticus TaxID=582475 RepID=A0ABT4ENA1_9BACI|nr:PhoU family transcriptional regulator [Lysinibacillus xylanilyticus]MCY9547013.1 PhoU family transcriptional regulator [Lysinibacillus xylanilyticus]